MSNTAQRLSLMPPKGATADEIAACVDAVLREATLAEKISMLSGRGFFKLFAASGKRWGADPYPAGSGCERLGIPPLYFTDGPRGVARGNSTCFPCVMARGASFDIDLEHRIGVAMAIEARAQGCTLSGAVCVNLLRHPAWGRAQETYGEDTHHLGAMGAALAQGLQTHNVIATVKHLALNSMENARFKVDVRCDDRTMRELFLPHFKAIIDAGCASVMSAYNQWNGTYCGEHPELLTHILRDEWGFEGFVHSDWIFGLRTVHAISAGLDIENPEPLVLGRKLLVAVEEGQVTTAAIETACRRILATQMRFAAAPDPLPAYTIDMVACDVHRALAREAAMKGAVLLKNEGVLPLRREQVRTLAVLGRLAGLCNTGDNGSSRVRPPYVITPLEGLRAACADGITLRTGDESDLAAAMAAAMASDVVVVVVGYTAADEGEYVPGEGIDLGQGPTAPQKQSSQQSQFMNTSAIGGDRRELGLPVDQVDLIKAAARTGKPVVVVIIAGSAVLVESWVESVGAILQTFYAGMEGGSALADLLFGDESPSGRLPFTVARDPADYPFLDIDADVITYGPFAGYTHFDNLGVVPRFPFGHGLSYTQFEYEALTASLIGDRVRVEATVANTGAVSADEVVLIFMHPPEGDADRPRRQLKGFTRVRLAPGERRTLTLDIQLSALMVWSPKTRDWSLAPGPYRFSTHAGLTTEALALR